jgi:hypothetical protein
MTDADTSPTATPRPFVPSPPQDMSHAKPPVQGPPTAHPAAPRDAANSEALRRAIVTHPLVKPTNKEQ